MHKTFLCVVTSLGGVEVVFQDCCLKLKLSEKQRVGGGALPALAGWWVEQFSRLSKLIYGSFDKMFSWWWGVVCPNIDKRAE